MSQRNRQRRQIYTQTIQKEKTTTKEQEYKTDTIYDGNFGKHKYTILVKSQKMLSVHDAFTQNNFRKVPFQDLYINNRNYNTINTF